MPELGRFLGVNLLAKKIEGTLGKPPESFIFLIDVIGVTLVNEMV